MFLNPVMLAGIGGAMLPLVLHLINRARFKTVDWAAMIFLTGMQPRRRHRHRIRQYILLALRMLIVSILAIALARPLVSDAWAGIATGGHVAAAIVVDGSASTALIEGGQPRVTLVKQTAIRILTSLHKGDEAVVINASDVGLRARPQLSSDLQRMTDDVASIQPIGRANLAEAMARAWDALDAPGETDRRLFVVCDRQAVSWREADAAFRSAWRDRLAGKPLSTPMTIIPVGGNTNQNLAITNVRLLNPPVVRDQPTAVQATVHAFGPARQNGVIVKFTAAGHELGRTTIDVPPDGEATADATIRLPEADSQLLTAAIDSSPNAKPVGLPGDDAMDLAFDVTDGVRVLLLTGDDPGTAGPTAQLFATTALRPFAAAGAGRADAFIVKEVPLAQAADTDVRSADVVLLLNVGMIPQSISGAIEQFIYDGGGVLIAPGPLTRASDWDDRFYRDGAGWLPASLAPPAGIARPADLASVDSSHPAWKFLRGRTDPPDVRVARAWSLSPMRPGARPIATLTGGAPACVDCSLGHGRVMELAMPLDLVGSNWPRHASFVPFLQSATAWLAGGGNGDRNVSAGAPLTYSWTGDDVSQATLDLPSGATVPLDPTRQGDRASIRFTQADVPGVYKLKLTRSGPGPTVVPFVVRRDPDESDLTPMRAADWQSLARDLQATVARTDAEAVAAAMVRPSGGREIWAWLVLAAMAVAMLELWLAGRWMRGTETGSTPASEELTAAAT